MENAKINKTFKEKTQNNKNLSSKNYFPLLKSKLSIKCLHFEKSLFTLFTKIPTFKNNKMPQFSNKSFQTCPKLTLPHALKNVKSYCQHFDTANFGRFLARKTFAFGNFSFFSTFSSEKCLNARFSK